MAGYNYVELHGRKAGIDQATGQIFEDRRPFSVSMTAAPSTANVTLVTMHVKDYFGVNVAGPVNMDIWLSDATTGAGLTATTASGAVAAGASGTDFAVLTTKKAIRVQTNASGVYILSITDTAKTAFKVCAQLGGKKAAVGVTLATASYG